MTETVEEIFKNGIPKFSQVRVFWKNRKTSSGHRINTRIPRSEWWRYVKCHPETVFRGLDGRITVYVMEEAEGAVKWQS